VPAQSSFCVYDIWIWRLVDEPLGHRVVEDYSRCRTVREWVEMSFLCASLNRQHSHQFLFSVLPLYG